MKFAPAINIALFAAMTAYAGHQAHQRALWEAAAGKLAAMYVQCDGADLARYEP
jgi:hypothetical protein